LRTYPTIAFWAACTIGVQAGAINFTGTQVDMNGTGFGNVMNVLSVMNRGSEHGSVLWNGAADVLGGDATNTSQTRTATAMQAAGIGGNKFAVYFNGNEPGNAPSVVLSDFTLHFLAADGSSLFNATYFAPSGGLTISDFGGSGQAGWLFEVTLTAAESLLFYGNGSHRLGMSVGANNAITDTAGGAENFFIGQRDDNPTSGGDPTPEPASIAVWAIAGLALLSTKLRRTSAVQKN